VQWKKSKKKPKERKKVSEDKLKEKQAENIKHGRPKNPHFPWSVEQHQNLVQSYLAGKSAKELANSFGRSKLGIIAQLEKIAGINIDMLEELSREEKQKRLQT
jgi:hypothetical protein